MKDILDRLGFYEFLGIWGPGAITITYYSFTLQVPLNNLFYFLGIKNPGFTKGYLIVILYTAIAYMVGVVLHEIGKLWSDYIFKLSPQRCKASADYSNTTSVPAIGIRREYKSAIETIIPQKHYDEISFDQANSELRHNPNADKKKAESYHAIYALSRSLFLCFMIHGFIVLCSLASEIICRKAGILIIAVDAGLTVLFAIRTYRYYYAWIKNVFVQHYLVCKRKTQRVAVSKKANRSIGGNVI